MIPVALALHRMEHSRVPALSWIALVAGMIGMLAAATVQALYVPRLMQTAQESILLTIALGLIGLWMVLVSVRGRANAARLPRGPAWLGIVVGVSLIQLPVTYILAGGSALIANPSSSLSNPLFIVGYAVGTLGISIGYAIWAIWLGRLFLIGKLPIPV